MSNLRDKSLGDIVSLFRTFINQFLSILIGISFLFIKLIFIFFPVYLLYRWNFKYSDKLLEFIRVLIWPMFAFYFIHQYKVEISELIQRIIAIPTPWGTLAAKQNKQTDKGVNENDLKKLTQNKELQEKDEQIKAERELGFSYFLKYNFEKAYRSIFGSQLTILRAMELTDNMKMSYNTIFEIYKTSEFYPGYQYNSYMGFLLAYKLVTHNGIDNTFTLSTIGQRFLNYLREEKIPLDKKPY